MKIEEILASQVLGLIQSKANARGLLIEILCAWQTVTAHAGDRKCEIHAFVYHHSDGHHEYLATFEDVQKPMGEMRTLSQETAVAAAWDWLSGIDFAEMYLRYEKLNVMKRKLQCLDEQLLSFTSKLTGIERIIAGEENYGEYKLIHGDRSAMVKRHSDIEFGFPFDFCWDEGCVATGTTPNLPLLAHALTRWLIDKALPSEMAQEFEFISPNTLAHYYEMGRGIEGEFIQSWDNIEVFYTTNFHVPREDYLALVSAMRKNGFDKTLRAGTSMASLILSRSRRHGAPYGQPLLRFFLSESTGVMRIEDHTGAKTYFDTIEYNQQLDQMLRQLEAVPIY